MVLTSFKGHGRKMKTRRRGLASRRSKERLNSWDKDIISTIEDDYLSFLNGLSWREGFGIEFASCTPESGKHLIKRIRKDLSNKKIDVLTLDQKIDNLISLIENFPNQSKLEILFIVGLEKSLVDYIREGYGGEGDYYTYDSIPPILSHINWQRENFRDRFPHLCLVFLLPKFALKYFIRRAPDFFDWSSGSFNFEEFTSIKNTLKSKTQPKSSEGKISKDKVMSRNYSSSNFIVVTLRLILLIVLSFLAIIAVVGIFANLPWYVVVGVVIGLVIWRILAFVKENSLLRIQRLNGQGVYLSSIGRYEEAVSFFDQALKINSKLPVTWKERGDLLDKLGRYEEAVISFDKALQIRVNDHHLWNEKGVLLEKLNRYEEAITSYDQALHFKSDFHEAWYNRSYALLKMGKYDEAIQSIDRSIKVEPNCCAYEIKAYDKSPI